MSIAVKLWVAALFFLLLTGCNRQPPPEKEAAGDTDAVDVSRAVARIGDEIISMDDLKWYLASRPPAPGAQTGEEVARKRMDGLIAEKVLAMAAREKGFDQGPAVKYAIDQMLAQRLIAEQIVRPVMEREIGEEEIQSYYTGHKEMYSTPKQVRIAEIFLAAPKSGPPEIRAQKKEEALRLVVQAQQAAHERFGFSRLVVEHSDKHPLYPKGDTGYFDPEGKPLGLDADFARTAFSLQKPGVVHDEVVATPEGFHIIMMVGIRPAVEKNLKIVAAEIEQRIRREEIESGRRKLVSALLAEKPVTTFDQNVLQVAGDLKAGNRRKNRTTEGGGSGAPNLPNLK